MKNSTIFSSIIGFIGAFFTALFGGWTTGMITLLIFMGIDYLSGLVVAGVFQKSNKSENGALVHKKVTTEFLKSSIYAV